jgi:hypothetical protein
MGEKLEKCDFGHKITPQDDTIRIGSKARGLQNEQEYYHSRK